MNTILDDVQRTRSTINSLKKQRLLIFVVTMFFAMVSVISSALAGTGYPLDDAWIHQTYARNFAETGKWFFINGIESGGSTSPLWTFLLSLGYKIEFLSPFFWTSLLSILLVSGLSLIGFEVIRRKVDTQNWMIVTGSILFGLEWHLIWSVSSGMETLLFCCLSLLLFFFLIDFKKPVFIGIIVGLMIWVRPDGLTLLGPLLLILIWKGIKKELNIGLLVKTFLPLVILYISYGVFNFSISGRLFPNTFYAKQFEYAVVLQQALPIRLMRMFLVPVSGAGFLLIPGAVWFIFKGIRKLDVWIIVLFLWFVGYGVLFALRLPMDYQHGRYLMPLIPAFFVLGISGWAVIMSHFQNNKKCMNIFKLIWVSYGIATVVFGIVGHRALVKDIQIIDQLMVQPAKWINLHTEESDIIAAHDIGALGYFGEREIIDLAGLIQQDIIPIIRDEKEIKNYIIKKQVDYLIIFYDWYEQMSDFGKVEETFEMDLENKLEIVEIRNLKAEPSIN